MTCPLASPPTSGSHCERCGRRLYYVARLHGHRWCRQCAAFLGVEQLGDPGVVNLKLRAARVEPWWRWTVYLEHALAWAKSDGETARGLG